MRVSPPTEGEDRISSTGSTARVLLRRPRAAECLAAIRAPALYRNFAVHLFVMFPAAMVMCWVAVHVDRELGLPPLTPWPALGALGAALIAQGGLWVWYVYGYLYLAGGGSPGTHVDGGPVALVDTGPYTLMRHPSVLGKLAGVVGLGLLWRSPVFLLGFVPVLVVYSVVTNRVVQERFCELRFGDAYGRYRARVPTLLPSPASIARWARDESALPEPALPVAEQPAALRSELPLYLAGLAGLLALFGLIWGVAALR